MSGDIEARLLEEITQAMQRETGLREDIARPFAAAVVRYLQHEYGGTTVYIPQAKRRHDRERMAAELRSGVPSREVARRHDLPLRQMYRLFPGGLPKPEAALKRRA